MAEAVLFNLATDILKLAGSITYSKSGLVCGVRDELNNLKDTVETIQGVLLDAETKRWHKKQVENWLRKLTEVLYDIQDLLDDVATEDLRREVTPGNNTWKAVRVFFSKSNQLSHRLKVANKTQELWKRLDRIKEERKFDLEERHSEETMAIVGGKKPEISNPDEQIIGRGKDKENIKQLLFDSSSSQSVSFVAIAGKGGLGKTALAQLVYNDWDVQRHFELHMWVCVSVVFDVNSIIKEIFKSATRKDHENKPIPELQILLHQTLNEKKYLLVLDDVWNEGRHKWLGLGNWLESGQKGSKILVTTRSHKVAEVMDAKSVIYNLPGLSNGQSWKLFRKMALGDGTEPLDPELEKTGRDIVKKCVGVPLAIRTMGCLLYSKEKDLWLRYKECELPEIPEIDEDDIEVLRVLKFSYDHLASSLKHCFAYCSLFPKDHIYKKDVMIHLWVAQGFIESHNEKDNLEEVAENYLSQLIWRSFLDVQEKGKDGKVLCFKMHDLMHDLAQKVAGNECKIVNFKRGDNNRSMRHASFISEISSKEKMVSLIKTSNLRTFLYLEGKSSTLHSPKVFSECKHCRALGLGNINIPLPPSSFGKLKQLRFLDISANRSIRSLPNSITDLVNLQVLRLFECMNLQTFPRDLRKLVKLKYLLIEKCRSLSHLPPLSELPSLRTLIFKQLNALKFLQWTSDPKQSNTTRPFFPSLERLSLLCCGSLEGWWGGKHRLDHSWPYFPELRFMEIRCCPCLSFVPPFLQVEYFTKMSEQQLMANPICPSQGTAESTFVAFSNLKHLYLDRMDLEPSVLNTLLRVASNLESLWLTRFNLRSLLGGMQHLSSLQEFEIWDCEGLDLLCQEDNRSTQWRFHTKLRVLTISSLQDLVALPEWIQHATTLQSLEISHCENLTSLPEWIGNFSLLEKLLIHDCPNVTCLPSEMRNLTRLKELRAYDLGLEPWLDRITHLTSIEAQIAMKIRKRASPPDRHHLPRHVARAEQTPPLPPRLARRTSSLSPSFFSSITAAGKTPASPTLVRSRSIPPSSMSRAVGRRNSGDFSDYGVNEAFDASF